MKKLLIDASLTGGRGPAKKAYEFTTELAARGIDFEVITDKGLERKLLDLGVVPDYVVDTSVNGSDEQIIKSYEEVLKDIDFDLMIKFGARVAGQIYARKRGIPYILTDGGLPDYLSEGDDLYGRVTFEAAEKVYLTTQFPWDYPDRSSLRNIELSYTPISSKSIALIEEMKQMDRFDLLNRYKSSINGKLPVNEQILIDLVMTGDYLGPENRVAYGAWLTARQYDQSVGFVRRLVTDAGEYSKISGEKVFFFMDCELRDLVIDLDRLYTNIEIITPKKWSFEAELAFKVVSDVTISRATNYQPYIAAICKGCNVTSPVPADGYMDEDTAAVLYEEIGLTRFIPYDDEEYFARLVDFILDKESIASIEKALEKNKKFRDERNLIDLVVSYIES